MRLLTLFKLNKAKVGIGDAPGASRHCAFFDSKTQEYRDSCHN